MKFKIRKGFNETVLSRIRQRRKKRLLLGITIVAVGCFAALVVSNIYFAYKQREDAKARNWPTWAAFTTSGETYVTHSAVTEDGVPTEINVNGEQWDIVKVKMFAEDIGKDQKDKPSDSLAKTFCRNKTITYIDHQSGQALRNSLMHEIFHAGDCLHGGDTWWNSENPTADDHPGVYHLGEFMTNFALANKPFMKWFEGE
jgi:hypothetical protein